MKKHTLIWITIFAITMGIFEGSVVVYLRALYYPNGFEFPLQVMDNQIIITEFIREFASLFMLLSVGILAGKSISQRFGWFLYSFAVWDIIYYVFLYLILGWPESLLTWDILFLLPVTWTGPVIAPVLISCLMIILGLLLNHFDLKIRKKDWVILICGSFVVFISFIWDYCRFIITNLNHTLKESFSDKIVEISMQYVPKSFPWLIFIIGFMIISSGITITFVQQKAHKQI
ncbi:MAG: hypothetical protein KQH79_04670 [Bacteroidetes bacterium]|nr:hypothetical protein [Bacteroidota bacterium]